MLQEKIAVITGGTAGIGRAIALKFAEEGATVVIIGTNAERGNQVLSELSGNNHAFYPADVAKKAVVDATFSAILTKYGRIDILVNNAGITRDQLLLKMTEEEWDLVINTNLKSCYNTCQAVTRSMLKAKRGKIINMSSVVGLTGNAGQANYAASKAGIIGFTKALAKELAQRNICINAIAPGFIETPMTNALNDAQKTAATSLIPMGRFGEPEEIANGALFLASKLSDYITGHVLTIDGGMVM